MTDRRRANGPAGDTSSPIFVNTSTGKERLPRPTRTRPANQHRQLFLQTGLTPSASGSAYLERQPSSSTSAKSLLQVSSSLKLACAVHGPKPLPRSAPFSPTLVLSTHIKFAPFATRTRGGHVRDLGERDLGMHLETALRAIVIGDRWPKSGVDVIINVLEAEDDGPWNSDPAGMAEKIGSWSLISTLAGCITVACAALVDTGIDCVDLVSGGTAGFLEAFDAQLPQVILDPCPAEHANLSAMCVVGYLESRDEIVELWIKGDAGVKLDALVDAAVVAARCTRGVLADALKDDVEARSRLFGEENEGSSPRFDRGLDTKQKRTLPSRDVEMKG